MGMNEKPIWTDSREAASDYSSKQYYGCKMTADKKVGLPTADTDVPAGLVINNPASGKTAQVLIVGRAPGVVAETITAGQKVRIANGGKIALWEKTDTTTYCVGVCVEGATVSADSPLGVFDFSFPGAIATA